ncbi:sensor histidine kinase [Paenibacillus sp. BC26]|uniref:sensor histidine kinase n=1 Tax=Paenibacillus sp. BC26 TaxID=1881032 RepID=UPI0008E74383|nr:sensor histidine kinase [Paenibacillus sp. BC26]SFT16340.1 two-component system, sensor histidine kinase YesM [Paenibacillus sp. BC26]
MKIRTKLIVANLFVVLLLLGSLTYVLMKRSSDLVYEHIIENAELSLSQVSANFDNKLSSYEENANTLFLNSSLNEKLQKKYKDQQEAYDTYFDYYQPFISAVQATKAISHLNLYTDNPTFLFANVFLIDEDTRQSDWYRKVFNNRIGGYWTGPYTPLLEHKPVFSFRKRMNNFDPASPNVVSIEIQLRVLSELINVESKSKRFIFSLSDGTVLIDSAQTGGITQLKELPFYSKIMKETEGSFSYEDEHNSYQIMFQTLESHNSVRGMKVLTFIPINELMPKIEQLRSLSVVLFLLAIVVSALFISTISVGLTRRLTELSFRMKRVHKDNFQSFVEVKGKDEVAQLGQMFNLMVQRVGQLIQEVYQSEIDQKEQALRTKEVELYALQTQINPHFLFNVLNMIRGKLLIAGERDTAKVVGLLAKSFRMMLRNGGPTITLSEEMEFISIYLQIQQHRFGDKFTFTIAIPPEALAVNLPKLCIQPLVENAITHGVELSPTQSRIQIKGELVEDTLQITVEDDGLGMTPERLTEIQAGLQQDSLEVTSNIGLRNVNRRLKVRYGDSYGLDVQSEQGAGTRVTIFIPMQQADNGGETDV